MKNEIDEAIRLRKAEKFDEAKAYLESLLEKNSNNPDIEYQIGWTYDASDQCKYAIPHYQKALELGLKNDRVGRFVALGSSLRAIGDYDASKKILELGLKEFPEYRPLKVFLAMTLYNLKEYKKAITSLLVEMAETFIR